MILCLVTDRGRLGRALGAPERAWTDLLVEQVRGAVAGGVDLVQVRERDIEAGALVTLVERLIAVLPGTAARVVVNDRLDVAVAAGASGVHLRQASFDVAAARRVQPGGLVGASVHDVEGARRRRGADYLVAGTVAASVSKPGTTPLGWAGLRAIVQAVPGCPVLGIGGLDLPGASPLAATGAAGLAAIGAFIPARPTDPGGFAQICAEKLRFAFDSATRLT